MTENKFWNLPKHYTDFVDRFIKGRFLEKSEFLKYMNLLSITYKSCKV